MSQNQRPAPIASELVAEFVLAAHRDLTQVQALLAHEPGLLNAATDWGGGDWETALGAAAHVGQREIAEFLLDQGAPMTIFAAAMLGKLSLVQAILTEYPRALHQPGAHGIPLLVHARQGGQPAAAVVRYLEDLIQSGV